MSLRKREPSCVSKVKIEVYEIRDCLGLLLGLHMCFWGCIWI